MKTLLLSSSALSLRCCSPVSAVRRPLFWHVLGGATQLVPTPGAPHSHILGYIHGASPGQLPVSQQPSAPLYHTVSRLHLLHLHPPWRIDPERHKQRQGYRDTHQLPKLASRSGFCTRAPSKIFQNVPLHQFLTQRSSTDDVAIAASVLLGHPGHARRPPPLAGPWAQNRSWSNITWPVEGSVLDQRRSHQDGRCGSKHAAAALQRYYCTAFELLYMQCATGHSQHNRVDLFVRDGNPSFNFGCARRFSVYLPLLSPISCPALVNTSIIEPKVELGLNYNCMYMCRLFEILHSSLEKMCALIAPVTTSLVKVMCGGRWKIDKRTSEPTAVCTWRGGVRLIYLPSRFSSTH